MPKRYSSNQVLKKLRKLGFDVVSQKGSHAKLKHENGAMTILPMGKRIVPAGTLNGVLNLGGISKLEFEKL